MEISGDVLVEINTTGSAADVTTFLTVADTTPGSTSRKLVVNPQGKFVLGEVTIESGFHVIIEGKFKIGGIVDIEGRFELLFTTNPIALTIQVDAAMELGPLGKVKVAGGFHVGETGLAAFIVLDFRTPHAPGADLRQGRRAGVQRHRRVLAQHDRERLHGLQRAHARTRPADHIDGSISFLGFAEAEGEVDLVINAQQIQI